MDIPSKTSEIDPPSFESAADAASGLAKNSPYRGKWTWRTRSETVILHDVDANADTVSGKLKVTRSQTEGGGTDTLQFADAALEREDGVWQFEFREKLAPDLDAGLYVFKMTGPDFLEGRFYGITPDVKYFLRSKESDEPANTKSTD